MNQTEQRNARIDKLLADIKDICEALEPGSITDGRSRCETARDSSSRAREESSADRPSITRRAT